MTVMQKTYMIGPGILNNKIAVVTNVFLNINHRYNIC